MKRITCLFLLMYLCCIGVKAQNFDNLDKVEYVAIYSLVFQKNSEDENSKHYEDMVLLIGDKYSKFSSLINHKKDSALQYGNPSYTELRNYDKTLQPYRVFKNKTTGEVTTQNSLMFDRLEYNESIYNIKWRLTGETSRIGGYFCQKATTHYRGRNYEAWFTNEIPVSDGPYKFAGLPGFVVQLQDTKGHYVFSLTSFSKTNDSHVSIRTDKVTKVSFDEYKRVREKAKKTNVITQLESQGIHLEFTNSSDKEKLRGKKFKFYNPIELE